MSSKLAIIGGSGLYQVESFTLDSEVISDNPFGATSSSIKVLKTKKGNEVLFLARHGDQHLVSPSEVNYRSNIFSLKQMGVTHILSVSAVGSLIEDLKPGDFFLPDQFIDWTKGMRKKTFFESPIVGHVSCADPVDKNFQQYLHDAYLKVFDTKIKKDGTYICIEGPQFSTRAESLLFKSMGCSVIGMTNVPEALLAKEAGMAYATLAMITDFDAWKEEHCTSEEIMKVMQSNKERAQLLLPHVVDEFTKQDLVVSKENQNVIISKNYESSAYYQDVLKTVLS